MKLWVKVTIAIILGILVLFGLFFLTAMFTTVKYGTPHYRPKVE
jgi:hypothetical protein